MNVEILVDSTPPCKSGLKAKSNKKQRPRSAGHPYTFEREENDRSDGIEQTCSGDFMKNFNDIVCQSMYQVINPHTEAELPSSSQMEFEDDMACNHIDPNATTPPCLLNNPDQTGTVPIIPTLFTNNQQQSYVSPPSNDNAPTSTTVDTEKPNSKLADFKVQDLKGECKKRQLPVSGTKTQLLDRLKPYEDEIFAPTSFTLHEDTDSVDSTIARVAHSHDISLSLTPTATAVIKPCCGNPSCNENSTIPVYFQQPHDVKQPTMRDVINNYLENPNQSLSTIAQNCQRELAKPQQLVLRVPQNSCQQQVVQLVDSNGAVIGVATVMNPPVQQNCCGCMQAQAKVNPGSITDRRRMTVPSMETRVDSGTTGIPLTQPQQINFGHVQANSIPSSNIPSQSTFSFAQLGSGGEFTLVQSTPLNETSCQGCSTTNCLSKQCSLPNHSTPIPTPSIVSPIQIAPKSAIASCHACHQTSQEVTRHPRKEEKLMPISTQRVSDDCCPKRNENQDVQLVRRRSLPSLNINTNQLVSAKSTEDQAREPPKHNPTIEEPKESPDEAKEEEECEEKEVDTSILFTAETITPRRASNIPKSTSTATTNDFKSEASTNATGNRGGQNPKSNRSLAKRS
uniref:SAP domain-containing protein n=1 Tax=Acrobeloides nanus TaxID=290746 RepID=A0A914EQ24_9BILA